MTLARIVSFISFAAMALIFVGDTVFRTIGIPPPDVYVWAKDNQVSRAYCVLGNAVRQLQSHAPQAKEGGYSWISLLVPHYDLSPRWLKMTAFFFVYFLSNTISSMLMNTGAFEVTYNGERHGWTGFACSTRLCPPIVVLTGVRPLR